MSTLDEWHERLIFVGSEDRSPILLDAAKELNDDEVRQLLVEYWSITEGWGGDLALRLGMLRLIRRVGFIGVDLRDGETYVTTDPAEALPNGPVFKVFRGNLGEYPEGHTWSLDYDTAEKFARMAGSLRGQFLGMRRTDGEEPVPSVWSAYVARERVLAYFNDRQEREVVLDSSRLRHVTLIAQAAPLKGGKA